MKIRYEKKNEIKTGNFWNLPNIDDTISNYFVVSHATNVEHFNYQTERKIMSGEHMKIWYEKKNEKKQINFEMTDADSFFKALAFLNACIRFMEPSCRA